MGGKTADLHGHGGRNGQSAIKKQGYTRVRTNKSGVLSALRIINLALG